MKNQLNCLNFFNKEYKKKYRAQKMLLSFQQYLELVKKNPHQHTRNSAAYILDTIEYFDSTKLSSHIFKNILRHDIFDLETNAGGSFVNNECLQKEIFDTIKNFRDKDCNDKLILIHGPNGAGKTSTVEKIAKGMELYSETEKGAVYCFNWIFPHKMQISTDNSYEKKHSIGFYNKLESKHEETYAFCKENEIQAKIYSNFRENPLFLLPIDIRSSLLKAWGREEDLNSKHLNYIPKHLQKEGLSKKNQQIFLALLGAYNGDLLKVFSHIQVERFFFSQKYQIGISTVNPNMAIDAYEKQLTFDRSYANLPAILQSINFYEAGGDLVSANRGLLEFSDFLKRPIDSFKYLLNTIEKGNIKLFSGIENVDIVYIATTNDKHLDILKTTNEFHSFQGRFEIFSLPYLRLPSQEIKIYKQDIKNIRKTKNICPHTIELLCLWAVFTRLKQPDVKSYSQDIQKVVEKLDPVAKLKLYENQDLSYKFEKKEQIILKKMKKHIWQESKHSMLYEGRFGFSPRDVRSLIYKVSQSNSTDDLTPQDLFLSLEKLVKEASIHEFLRIEPMGAYHNCGLFIEYIKDCFYYNFKQEITLAILGNSGKEYDAYLKNYIDHAICFSKKEKTIDQSSKQLRESSEELMQSVEAILGIRSENREQHRDSLLSKIAAYKLENFQDKIDLSEVFSEYLKTIKAHFFDQQKETVIGKAKEMIDCYINKYLDDKNYQKIAAIYQRMRLQFGYTTVATCRSLEFFLKHEPKHHVLIKLIDYTDYTNSVK